MPEFLWMLDDAGAQLRFAMKAKVIVCRRFSVCIAIFGNIFPRTHPDCPLPIALKRSPSFDFVSMVIRESRAKYLDSFIEFHDCVEEDLQY